MNNKVTTIKIYPKTKAKLDTYKTKELKTYNQVIEKLLEMIEN